MKEYAKFVSTKNKCKCVLCVYKVKDSVSKKLQQKHYRTLQKIHYCLLAGIVIIILTASWDAIYIFTINSHDSVQDDEIDGWYMWFVYISHNFGKSHLCRLISKLFIFFF